LAVGYSLPYSGLSERLHGLRKRELTLLTAGSGIGKSTLAREIAYHLHQEHGLTIGNVYLEESKEKTAQGYIAIHNNVPLGCLRERPVDPHRRDVGAVPGRGRPHPQFFYDHFGSLDSENLLSKLRYLAVGCKCDFIILDHISIVVSGQESSSEGERKDIDILMTNLRSLVENTGVGIIAIVHLNKPPGMAHEEGGARDAVTSPGSGSLKQLSDNVVAVERDQQGTTATRACSASSRTASSVTWGRPTPWPTTGRPGD
jgi:twinkle protein